MAKINCIIINSKGMKDKNIKSQRDTEITRKEALKKMGTYAAFTALGTMMLLSPKDSQAGTTVPLAPTKRESR